MVVLRETEQNTVRVVIDRRALAGIIAAAGGLGTARQRTVVAYEVKQVLKSRVKAQALAQKGQYFPGLSSLLGDARAITFNGGVKHGFKFVPCECDCSEFSGTAGCAHVIAMSWQQRYYEFSVDASWKSLAIGKVGAVPKKKPGETLFNPAKTIKRAALRGLGHPI